MTTKVPNEIWDSIKERTKIKNRKKLEIELKEFMNYVYGVYSSINNHIYFWTASQREAFIVLAKNNLLTKEQQEQALNDMKECDNVFDKMKDEKKAAFDLLPGFLSYCLRDITCEECEDAINDIKKTQSSRILKEFNKLLSKSIILLEDKKYKKEKFKDKMLFDLLNQFDSKLCLERIKWVSPFFISRDNGHNKDNLTSSLS
jgi:hypothetical protein